MLILILLICELDVEAQSLVFSNLLGSSNGWNMQSFVDLTLHEGCFYFIFLSAILIKMNPVAESPPCLSSPPSESVY